MDYSQTPLQRCHAVLEFLQLHDGMPARETFSITMLLMQLLQLSSPVASDTVEIAVPTTVMRINFKDRGEIRVAEEDEASILIRPAASSLCHLSSPLSLRKKDPETDEDWTLSSGAPVANHLQEPVGRRVLTYFQCSKSSKLYGLSDAKLLAGDRLWQPPNARFSFIVRPVTSSEVTIVGRAQLFELDVNDHNARAVTPQHSSLDKELVGEETCIQLGINQLMCLAWLTTTSDLTDPSQK